MSNQQIQAPYLVLYDGECGICQKSVQFILKNDLKQLFLFAPLQSKLATELLSKAGKAVNLDTIVLCKNAHSDKQQFWQESEAFIEILSTMSPLYAGISALLKVIPKIVRNWFYRRIATNRLRLSALPFFQKHNSCMLLTPEQQKRFLNI